MSTIVVAAGGTGGHLFPAQALAEALVQRGHTIHLVTDERVADYGKAFPASAVHVVPSATLTLSQPLKLPSQALRLARGVLKARGLLKSIRPAAVVGFGGYPSLPPLIAASQLAIATVVHEQNAVLGRANKLLAWRVDRIASSFPEARGLPDSARQKLVITGNPVRGVVLTEKAARYPSSREGFNLLVFGGSQGARFFAEFMPEAAQFLTSTIKVQLSITQQCRSEDLSNVKAAYEKLGLKHELNSFFSDMPLRIAGSHLVFCRSGASTIAELGVIGRPAIMVPLPHALDNDQLRNAESFAKAGAGWVKPQVDLQPQGFAEFLRGLMETPDALTAAAAAALTHGRPDAAERLADVVEGLALKHEERVRI
jgi:UDP-N-acetylglucosamine--N-acetylmuramyl-(pentapeptide) pyrophosphoryl-undecaprenol N-acetylglucosamine transferase